MKLIFQMFKWLFLSIASMVITILAYPVVPVAVLFRKDGHLPKIFYWFETYDSPVEGEKAHWERWKAFREKWGKFGMYCQCVGWLWRNKGYNFAYHVCGIDVDNSKVPVLWSGNPKTESGNPEYNYGYVWATSDTGWCLFTFIPWIKIGKKQFCLRMYLGWKFKGRVNDPRIRTTHHMLACHVNPFRIREL